MTVPCATICSVGGDFTAKFRRIYDRGSSRNFRERLEELQSKGQIPQSQDLDALFSTVSYFSFASYFPATVTMGRSHDETIRLYEEFARIYATGVCASSPGLSTVDE